MGRRAGRKTDFGTVILHWLLVFLLAVSVGTGLRIATVSPLDFAWLRALDGVLPQRAVWTAHMPAALGFIGLSLAYVIYLRRAGLVRRIRPDRVRMMGLVAGAQARWSAVNILLNWILFLTLLTMMATGALMYLGYGGGVIALHRLGTWIILAFPFAHVAAHWAIGGAAQLWRILRPAPLPRPAPPFDPIELLTPHELPVRDYVPLQPDHSRGSAGDRRTARSFRTPHRHGTTLQANPFVVATAAGMAGMAMVGVFDQAALQPELQIRRIDRSEAPAIDGDFSDPVWRTASPVAVRTNQGANFDGAGTTVVEIRAVHDGETAYFSFVWDDPTRSLKHLPLIKRKDGWHVVQAGYDVGDEGAFHEDKLAVLFTRADVRLAGDRTFHAGRAPAEGKPATLSGRGLHFTRDGSIADVWQWKATSGGTAGGCEDNHFGPPAEPKPAEVEGRSPYKGGFAADPGRAGSVDNFEPRGPGGYDGPVRPLRLPKDWKATWSAMGRVGLDPGLGESDGARWWMAESESLPYAPEFDARFPLGALIPGVIVAGEPAGDRADVRCAARWAAGRWALEAMRRLDTANARDVRIETGVFMRVAAFDRSQIRHTRHVRPIRIEVR